MPGVPTKAKAPLRAPSGVNGGVDGTLLKVSNRHAATSFYARTLWVSVSK